MIKRHKPSFPFVDTHSVGINRRGGYSFVITKTLVKKENNRRENRKGNPSPSKGFWKEEGKEEKINKGIIKGFHARVQVQNG